MYAQIYIYRSIVKRFVHNCRFFQWHLLPCTYVQRGKVMFSQVSVCPWGRGWSAGPRTVDLLPLDQPLLAYPPQTSSCRYITPPEYELFIRLFASLFIGGYKPGAPGMCVPPGQIFFSFSFSFGEKLVKIPGCRPHLCDRRPLLWEILDPPLLLSYPSCYGFYRFYLFFRS